MTSPSGNVQVVHSEGGVHVTAENGDEIGIIRARLTPQRARVVAWAMIAAADDAERWQREHAQEASEP